MLKLLHRRIESKAESFLGDDQFGFRRGRGARDAIAMMRVIGERSLEHEQEMFTCFIDFEKAFDMVRWDKLLEILKKIGVDWKDRRLISELYMNEEAIVRVNGEETNTCVVGRGVRQGCPLSPLLFNIYAEQMVKEALEDIDEGVTIGGCRLKTVR